MGNAKSADLVIRDNPDRKVFITFEEMDQIPGLVGTYVTYTFTVRYQRFIWKIFLRYNEIVQLDKVLMNAYSFEAETLIRPRRYNKMLWSHDKQFLDERAQLMTKYLQEIADRPILLNNRFLRKVLNISAASFRTELGRKGREGFLYKCSGGYVEKFSRQAGDFMSLWQWRWMVLHESCIGWYKNEEDPIMRGNLRLDQGFAVFKNGRIITVVTETRKLVLKADTMRNAHLWWLEIKDFYKDALRTKPNFFESSFPPRMLCDVKAYTYSKDYMAAVAIALLGAQKEILITSWKNSPTVILSRPPFPTVRLDQILRYKALQGVNIYILLYKEVDYVGQSNDSLRSKAYLESLHSNIHVIRHPNKFVGGATAVLWSHHEKTVVIDRNLCFVGGIDLAFQRWDDEQHRVADEEGLIFPGPDYRNPAPGLFKPLRTAPDPNSSSSELEDEDDMIEVEVAVPGEQLPQAASVSAMGPDDDACCEVEVVVDFGVADDIVGSSSSGSSNSGAMVANPSAQSLEQRGGRAKVDIFTKRHESFDVSQQSQSQQYQRDSGWDDNSKMPSATAVSGAGGRGTMPVIPEASPVAATATTGASAVAKSALSPSAPAAVATPVKDATDDTGKSAAAAGMIYEDDDDGDEDRNMPETAEEREAVLLYTGQSNMENDTSTMSTSGSEGSFSDSDGRSTNYMSSSSISSSIATTGSKMKSTFSKLVTHMREQYNGRTTMKSASTLEPRDMYPRMPWHDLQCAVTGMVARDVACHFIQRWNHHRLSASQYAEPILYDIIDEEWIGVCARCRSHNLSDRISECPTCGNDLGPINSYSVPDDPEMCPRPVDDSFSYLVFECKFPATTKLPFLMQGDCPVVVTALLQSANNKARRASTASAGLGVSSADAFDTSSLGSVSGSSRMVSSVSEVRSVDMLSSDTAASAATAATMVTSVISVTSTETALSGSSAFEEAPPSLPQQQQMEEGNLLDVAGPHAEWLTAFGLTPAVGDVILAVDGAMVTQLNSNQFKRLIKMKRRSANANMGAGTKSIDPTDEPAIPTVSIIFRRHHLENLYPSDSKHELSVDGTISPVLTADQLAKGIAATSAVDADSTATAAAGVYPAPAPAATTTATDAAAGATGADVPDASAGSEEESGHVQVAVAFQEEVTAASSTTAADDNASAQGDGAIAITTSTATATTAGVCFLPFQRNESKVRQFHPACQAAAQQELRLAMSQLFHNFRRNFDVPMRLPDGSGTCKVQLLRSIGKWSTGTKTECSILRCYTESIKQAHHLVYIESQFFVGNTAGPDVQNDISSAIVERILRAHAGRESFRVIVIIPVHPNGDFVSASKAKVVMHYEYATINRGVSSLFERLKSHAPDINISKYIGFFSLRNWGVINGKVVSDQVYVHDKLIIVDDRVAIIGSANINDRSMLGMRDSEVAVRIEDTLHIDVLMNNAPFAVGYFPHMLRTRLMRQHLGVDDSTDVSDVHSERVMRLWTSTAQTNSSLYDSIDGGISVYRCSRITDFTTAFASYRNPSIYDPETKAKVDGITGFLVDWPKDLFCKEDLSPSLATRTIIPNELWV